jgi:short-subunit dehydrogenase
MRRAGKGLLVYTGSGINRLPDPFTGPYAASKAAGDVLAEVRRSKPPATVLKL